MRQLETTQDWKSFLNYLETTWDWKSLLNYNTEWASPFSVDWGGYII